MINTINEAWTPGELAAWLRQWADGADASDYLDATDARQLAEAVERVCAPGNAAALREALVEILDRTNREKARDYDAALNGGILEIHDIANTALNQERTADALEKAPAPGNAAALREALERCNELFRCDDDNKSLLCHLARKADEATQAALAAPARNCDARDVHEAWRDFLADKRFADCSATFQAGANAAIRWLYATAQEGGAEYIAAWNRRAGEEKK